MGPPGYVVKWTEDEQELSMPGNAAVQQNFLGTLEPDGRIPYLLVPSGPKPRWAFPMVDRRVLKASMSVYMPGTARAIAAWYAAALTAGTGLGSLLPGARRSVDAPMARELAAIVGLQEAYLAVASSFDGERCVIAIVDAHGNLRGFAKVARGDDAVSIARLQTEADVLRRLETTIPGIELPRVLRDGRMGELEVLVITAIRGRPGVHPSKLTRRRVDAAAQIFSVRGKATTISQQLDFEMEDARWAERLEAVRTASEAVADLPLPSGLVHGDFAAWNLIEHGRRVGVVDWEHANFDGLPYWDVWHFSVQAAGPARSDFALHAIHRAVRGEGKLGEALNRYATMSGVPVGLAPDVLLVYLVRRASTVIERSRLNVEDANRALPFLGRLLDEALEVLS
jgi:tRNA A-37 threonylcarbamoyl transferase component Bud32